MIKNMVNRKIRIAYFIDSMNSLAGTEKQLIQMIQHLNKKYFEIKLICLRSPSSVFDVDKEFVKYVEYMELNIRKLLNLRTLYKLVWLVWYLRKEKIDIIQTYFFDATVIGVIAGRIACVKNIISCRRDLGFWYTPKLIRVLKIINRMTTRVLANSFAVKTHIIEMESIPEAKIDIIKNGIDLMQFNKKFAEVSFRKLFMISDQDYVVGIVANFNRPVKRVDVFVRAASEVLNEVSNVSFVIIGDGYLGDELKRMAEQLGISDKIRFLGRRNDVHSLISSWDVGVLSSDSEGFSNSILEYMAAGLPIVATNIGGNREAVQDGINGFLVNVGDFKFMAEKICDLLQNRNKRSEMSKNAKLLIEKDYIWEKRIVEIESYYYDLPLRGMA